MKFNNYKNDILIEKNKYKYLNSLIYFKIKIKEEIS